MLPTVSLLAGLSSRPSMPIIATDSCLQIPCKATVRAYLRLHRPGFLDALLTHLVHNTPLPYRFDPCTHARIRATHTPHVLYCIRTQTMRVVFTTW
jgi:hypothetical protein